MAVDKEVLRFEVAVDDATRVAEVDAIDELVHDTLDLTRSDRGLVGRQVSL